MTWALFRRRRVRPALKIVADNPGTTGTDIGAVVVSQKVYEMSMLHPDLKTVGKQPKVPEFLVGFKGGLFRVRVETVR